MLAKRPLTARGIAAIKSAEAGKRKLYWDAVVPGLAVRVTDTGVKAFVVVKRFPGSPNPTARSIGKVGAVTLEAARAQAREWLAQVAVGRDPASEAEARMRDTLRGVSEEWLERKAKGYRSASALRSRLDRLVFPALGAIPIREIRKSDIVRLHDRVTDESGPVAANRVVELLTAVMNWHATRSDDFRSPIVRGMTSAEVARDRTLTDGELRSIWKASAGGAGADSVFGALIRFLLLTGARRSEGAEMKWVEITASEWTSPATRNKVRQELVRPLSGAALAIVEAQVSAGDFVFSRDGRRPLVAFTELKATLDETSGVSDWRLHDLRRTSRSLMSRAGVPSDHAERCLGHVIGGVRGVYDRHTYREEMLIAYEKLASLIAQIVDPQENVVAIRGQR
jgi:integrase